VFPSSRYKGASAKLLLAWGEIIPLLVAHLMVERSERSIAHLVFAPHVAAGHLLAVSRHISLLRRSVVGRHPRTSIMKIRSGRVAVLA
jgi:hypothetical protein